MDIKDLTVFEGKTFSDLMKDIYDNSSKKKKQIDLLVKELGGYISGAQDAAMVVPLIKDFLDVGVRNDEQLIKMANVVQKHVAADARASIISQIGGSDGSSIMTEEEKNELLREINAITTEDISEIKKEEIVSDTKRIDKELDELLSKTDEILSNKNEDIK